MTDAPPAPDPCRLHRIALAIRGWLWTFAAWALEVLGDRWLDRSTRLWIRAELAAAERDACKLIVLMALAKLGPPPDATASGYRCAAPPGFRRQDSRASVERLVCGWIPRGRGSIRARLKAFHALLDALDRHAARVAKQLQRGFRPAVLVLAWAFATACADMANVAAPAHDSS
ncbi:MAG: hypothetical protein NW200_11000 [Hyphomonadaceae bacterium]|nr:hypothetical protein [Hyphomonadaceae bacterium]